MHCYAIGDIHGHLELLKPLHALIAKDMEQHGKGRIIHMGDLIDRGPDSKGTIDYLMEGMARGEDWEVLKGNHDRLMTMFMNDPLEHDPGLKPGYGWLHHRIGGVESLESYGVMDAGNREVADVHAEAAQKIPQSHLDFIDARPNYLEECGVIFAHAGIRPGVPMAEQTEHDLLWIRVGWLDYEGDLPKLVIHGHTAIDTPTHYGHRVNIDSSAAYGGPLSAIVVEDDGRIYHLTESGRVLLEPVAPEVTA